MSEPAPTRLRELLDAELATLAPGLKRKEREQAVRRIIKGVVAIMVADGYTLAIAAQALGEPRGTLEGWRSRDKAWAAQLGEAREVSRRWLISVLRKSIKNGDKAAGKAMNILAHLWFEELRSTKQTVDATVKHAVPQPGESRGRILSLVNTGEDA